MLYKNILVATAFSEKCDHTLSRAKEIAKFNQANLYLVHFLEPLVACAFTYASVEDIEKQRSHAAKEKLNKLSLMLEIPEDRVFLEHAMPRAGIVNLAKKLRCDLIILGRHGHHPIASILGTTANAVAQHADCDILIVK